MRRLLLVVLVFAATLSAQLEDIEGPTILSRGPGTLLQGGGELARLKPYFSISGGYDTALTPVSVGPTGEIPQSDAYGGEMTFGVNGYHRWRRTLLGINYRGDVRKYANSTYYDGSDQTLIMGVTHQPTRSLGFTLRQAAGTYSRNYGWFSGQEFFSPSFAQVPVNELFDSRTDYLTSMADLIVRKGSRLSFDIGGTRLFVRRRSSALIGVEGWMARGDVAYRLSRRATIGWDYNFTHYVFSHSFGASDLHGTAMNLSFRLGRRWDMNLRAGGIRAETLGLQRVAVDPIIAAIIHQTTGIEVFYGLQYFPTFSGTLSRVSRGSVLSFNYDDSPSSGNGIYMLSRGRTGGVSYSQTAYGRLNVGLSAGYSSYKAMAQSLGRYESYSAGAGLNLQLKRWLNLTSRYDARTFDVADGLLHRFSQRATLGLAFTPGETVLSLW